MGRGAKRWWGAALAALLLSSVASARTVAGVEMPENRSAIGTRLVEDGFHGMRQEGRGNGNEKRVVAGSPQLLARSWRSYPSCSGEDQQYLFVGSPSESARNDLRTMIGVARHGARDEHIRLRGLYSLNSHNHRIVPSY